MEATNPIEHLDFEVEEEKEPPKPVHFAHPIEPNKTWCGITKNSPRIPGSSGTTTPIEEITCVDCLHLYISKGPNWWWRVNQTWYEKNG